MKKIIFGLGNPGEKYQFTRHNAGFLLLDYLQQKLQLPKFSFNKKIDAAICSAKNLMLVKPQLFMNLSGEAVAKTLAYFNNEFQLDSLNQDLLGKIWVAHDDLDLEVGQYKIQRGTGPKQHHGVLSIYQALKTKDFWHIRIGVDDRRGQRLFPPEKYVLQRLPANQQKKMKQVFADIHQELAQKIS